MNLRRQELETAKEMPGPLMWMRLVKLFWRRGDGLGKWAIAFSSISYPQPRYGPSRSVFESMKDES
jgi:hypothetical protein